MLKTSAYGACLCVLFACSDANRIDGNAGTGGAVFPTGGTGGVAGAAGTSGTGGLGVAAGGTGGSAAAGTGGTGPLLTGGGQLAFCDGDMDCNDGLECYGGGNYCSATCAGDADCTALGSNYTCGGLGGGGGFMDDAGAEQPTGTCRITCSGEDDSSCPDGMSCQGGFGGGGGGGTFRCAYPEDGGAMMMNAGTAQAFAECGGSGDCADGLTCTARRGGTGYCTQPCQDDAECTSAPASGSVSASCGFGDQCTLSCAGNESGCPDGMTCEMGGGGGQTFAFCNY